MLHDVCNTDAVCSMPSKQVDDALEFMKDEYNTRMDNCDQREVGLRKDNV